MEEAALLCAGERSDKAIVDNWLRCRMVKGDGHRGRRQCLVEEDADEYNSRIEWPPGDVIAALEREQVKQDKIQENIFAAGAAYMAHESADLATSTHRCCGCGLKVHSLTLCGKSLDTLLIDQPCLVGCTLLGGRVISEGADNEMHCMCFTCIGKMTTAGCMDVAAAGKENIVNGSNPIANCSWDDVVVMTTLTNESFKATNAT